MYVIVRKNGQLTEITKLDQKPPERNKEKGEKRTSRSEEESDNIYGARRSDSLKRTRKICLRSMCSALEAFGRPLMVTLTLNKRPTDAKFASDSLRKFFVRLRDTYPKAECIFVPELSPGGRIHFHGLIFNVPMHLGDIQKAGRTIKTGREREERILADAWREGYVDAKQTDGSTAMANYLSKYVMKSKDTVLFNAMRLVRKTRGIPKGKVIRGKLAEEIAEDYSDKKAFFEYEGEHEFVGKFKKEEYFDELINKNNKK